MPVPLVEQLELSADCFVLKRSEEQLEACSGSELIIPVRSNLHDLGS